MLAIMSPDDIRWAAVTTRDRAQDGAFYFSVRTTGVYCNPSCGARLPRRENVAFHDTRAAAEAAGFRPCKRCKPDQPPKALRDAALVAEACRAIEAAETPPGLDALAQSAGLSPHHFHRLFKAVTGVTPKAYADAHRAGRVRQALPVATSVTEAIYDAGFNSNGRFYAASQAMLGMSPTRYRAGAPRTAIRFAAGAFSLGDILVAATDKGVCAILIGDDPDALLRDLQDRFPKAELVGGDAAFEALVARVVGLLEQPKAAFDLPLDIQGTAFQQRVWQALRRIGPGQTRSYAEIAEAIGAPNAVRAVGAACGANPIAVAIPCHRVVRRDGDLAGYRWGIERKRALLARGCRVIEAIDQATLEADLDAAFGVARLPGLIDPAGCRALTGLYDRPEGFRKQVIMARHGYGRGEYRYFAYPLPDPVQALRTALYPCLAPIANRWYAAMGLAPRFPDHHADFLARCHAAGQTRPTPLMLRYGEGDYNCLHQDLYGEHVFPLQAVVLLSEPGRDFEGGELVLTEQRPRMQSRAEVVPLAQGDAAVFAVRERPVRARGTYRVSLRHGVSRLRSGHRTTLGIIFHDAA